MRLDKAHLLHKSAVFAAVVALTLGFGAASSLAADGARYYGSFGHHDGAGSRHGHGARHGINFHDGRGRQHGAGFGHGGDHRVVRLDHGRILRHRITHPGLHHTNVLAALARHHVPVVIHGGDHHRRHGGHHLAPHFADTLHLGYKHYGNHAYKAACHPVSKVDYVGHGRKAKVVGTMCYDAYGNPYVVAGSRRVIHYY